MDPVRRLSLEGTTGEYTPQSEFQVNHGPFGTPGDGNSIPDITIQNVDFYAESIPEIDSITTTASVVNFGESELDVIELHIINLKGVLLESVYDIPYNKYNNLLRNRYSGTADNISLIPAPNSSEVPNVSLDLHSIFRDLGYLSGKFKFQLNLHRNLLGSRYNTAVISEVSDDRLEASISFDGVSYLDDARLVDEKGNRIEFYLNLKLNNLLRIAGFTKDIELSNDRTQVYTISFPEPLPGDIGVGYEIWIDQQMADPISETIILLPKKKKDPINNLRIPNFNIEVDAGFAQSTGFRTWNTILGSNPTSSQQIINRVLSSSIQGIDLNVDYRKYSNFVFYGSAVDRLENFKYKLQLIEYYDGLLQQLNTISSPGNETSNNIIDITSKKNTLLGGLDGYEKYLYYESSSYETSSYGEFWPTTWPKQNAEKPYLNFSVTSSQGISWYNGQYASASAYDDNNLDSLYRVIPEFISTDVYNESFVTFVNMIGQHFDILRSYVEQIPNIHSRKEPLYEGLAKDLVYQVLASMGVDVINGFNIQDLWLYSLGVNQSGSYTQSGSLQSIPTDDIVKETWKRILNNLPYLLKTKGTERGIRALINCYGVPATVYRVKEYSGPYQYDSTTVSRRDRYKKVEKFTYALFLTGSETVQASVGGSSTLQYRFKPTYSPNTQTISSSPVSITLEPSGSSKTIGILTVGGTAYSASFYDVWTSISIGGGKTYIVQNRDGYINYYQERNTGTAGAVTLGGSNCNFAVQEIRFWNSSLDTASIKEYCLNPQSIVGEGSVGVYDNTNWQINNDYDYTTGWNQLLARYPLGSTLQIFGTGSVHPKQSSAVSPATVAGTITTASFVGNVESYFVWVPNLGDSIDVSNKIRIEPNALSGQLSTDASVEKSQYDTYQLDSPKVGVFFSPQDEINEDIADQFSGLLLDDFIGDPRDDYEWNYKALETLKGFYRLKYNDRNQIWKYIKLVENFDASMFYLIKKFLPARSAKMVGLVIQPTILERSKFARKRPEVERMDYLSEIPMTDQELTGEYPTYESVIEISEENVTGDILLIESNAEPMSTVTATATVPYYEGDATAYQYNNTISSNVISAMDSAGLTYYPASYARSRFLGSKISSPGFNIPSEDTYDGAPVIQYWNTNPGTIGTTANPSNPIGVVLGPGTVGIGSSAAE